MADGISETKIPGCSVRVPAAVPAEISETRPCRSTIPPGTSDVEPHSQTPAFCSPLVAGTEDLYATQYFQFTVKSFCNGLYNSFNSFMLDCLRGLSDFLQQQLSPNVSDETINSGSEKIRQKFVSIMDKSFDKLEKYLQDNTFHIPSHVLLEEDQAHATGQVTAEKECAVDQDIKQLTETILSLKSATASLRNEVKILENAQAQTDAVLKEFTLLQRDMNQCGVSDLQESLSFTLYRIHQCLEVTGQVCHLRQETEDMCKENTVNFSLDSEMETLGWDMKKNVAQT